MQCRRLRLCAKLQVSLRVSSACGYFHVSQKQQSSVHHDVEKADAGPGSRKGSLWSARGESGKHVGAVEMPRCSQTVHMCSSGVGPWSPRAVDGQHMEPGLIVCS